MLKLPSTVLVLAPHTDDAELGAGASIARLVEEGSRVYIMAFSTCQESLPPGMSADTLKNELLAAGPYIGVPVENIIVKEYPVRRLNEYRQAVLDDLIDVRAKLVPDMVLMPSSHDLHQDHAVVHLEGLRAFKHSTVLGYELPWNNITFDSQAFFCLEGKHVEAKCSALRQYHSQIAKKRKYFASEIIYSWLRFRGLQVNTEFAEVFEVIRAKW